MASKILSLASVASLLALSVFAMPACSSADPASDGEKAETTDETSSAFGLSDTKIVGSLDYGQTSAKTAYTKTPRYRAFKFGGNGGDEVDVWVKSTNGDPVTWILDNNFAVIAKNDDAAAGNTNSHVKATLPASASITHYIVVRDYWLDPMNFTVELKGGSPDFAAGCNVDADCAKVDKACCANYGSTSVLASNAAAYKASLHCQVNQICPLFMTRADYSAAECNGATHKCELVKPADIKCGGFIAPAYQHQCPSGYNCSHIGVNPDVGGKCVQFCGGIAGFQCHEPTEVCVDNPNDSCDPAHGGADCGGICQPGPT